MAQNLDRRNLLADAGIRVLAEQGARGLTHRAVDQVAGVPKGTASNYFATRDELVEALVNRIGDKLEPGPTDGPAVEGRAPDQFLFADYLQHVVRRLRAQPHVTLALFELRLEASRRPGVAESLARWRQQSFERDVEFTRDAGLPGGRLEITLLHYAIDGLMLDCLTAPLDTGLSVEDAVEQLVSRIFARVEGG